jgi:xanthine dehydrogenase large subunit
MGQGVTTKMQQIAARTLGCELARVTIAATSTTTVANTSPTAASSGADLNGMAVKIACSSLRERLDAMPAGLTWESRVAAVHQERVSLSAAAHYATPRLDYDKDREWGSPFAYHVYGMAITEVTLDCLMGTYQVDSVKIVHDAGKSLAPLVDRGQVEGALAQGIGWLTLEELAYDGKGRLLSKALATYKAPDIHSMPKSVEVQFLEDADNPAAVLGSKGIGEPPLMYGIGTFFALRDAARAFRSTPRTGDLLHAPLTPERLLMYLQGPESEA